MQQILNMVKNLQESLVTFVNKFHRRECVNEENIIKLQNCSDNLLANDTDLLFEICLIKLGITEEEV